MNTSRLSYLDVYTCDPFANTQDVSNSNGFIKNLEDNNNSSRITITENPLNNHRKSERYSTIQKKHNQQYDNDLGRESISFLRRSPLIVINMIDKFFTGSFINNRKSVIGQKSTNHIPNNTVSSARNHSVLCSNDTASSSISSLQSSLNKLGDSKEFKVTRATFDLDSARSSFQPTTPMRSPSPRVKRVEDPIFEDWNWSSE